MVCPFCGKEIPDGAAFCDFCKNSAEPEREEPADEYGVYDEFGDAEEDVAPDDGYPEEPDAPEADAKEESGKARMRGKRGKGAVTACILLAALLCLLVAGIALSGIVKYTTRDAVIKRSVMRDGLDAYPVSDESGEKSFSEFICGIIENSGKELGLKRRDINKLLKEDALKAYFANVFVGYKNDLLRGDRFEPYNCKEIADWMFNHPDVVKKVTGVTVGEEAGDRLKEGLGNNELDIGSGSFEDIVGVDRGAAVFLTSDVFLYVSLVLCVGLAALIFILSDYDPRFFLTCLGAVLLSAGIVLLAVFGYIMIAGYGARFLSSVLLSAALKPFIAVCAALIVSGAALAAICYVLGKKRRKAQKRY